MRISVYKNKNIPPVAIRCGLEPTSKIFSNGFVHEHVLLHWPWAKKNLQKPNHRGRSLFSTSIGKKTCEISKYIGSEETKLLFSPAAKIERVAHICIQKQKHPTSCHPLWLGTNLQDFLKWVCPRTCSSPLAVGQKEPPETKSQRHSLFFTSIGMKRCDISKYIGSYIIFLISQAPKIERVAHICIQKQKHPTSCHPLWLGTNLQDFLKWVCPRTCSSPLAVGQKEPPETKSQRAQLIQHVHWQENMRDFQIYRFRRDQITFLTSCKNRTSCAYLYTKTKTSHQLPSPVAWNQPPRFSQMGLSTNMFFSIGRGPKRTSRNQITEAQLIFHVHWHEKMRHFQIYRFIHYFSYLTSSKNRTSCAYLYTNKTSHHLPSPVAWNQPPRFSQMGLSTNMFFSIGHGPKRTSRKQITEGAAYSARPLARKHARFPNIYRFRNDFSYLTSSKNRTSCAYLLQKKHPTTCHPLWLGTNLQDFLKWVCPRTCSSPLAMGQKEPPESKSQRAQLIQHVHWHEKMRLQNK